MYVRGAPFKEDWSIGKSRYSYPSFHLRPIPRAWIDSANFRTSDEAAYPLNFCRQIALRVSALAEAAGYIPLDPQITLPSCGKPWKEVCHFMMASVGAQSSGNRLNQLPPSSHAVCFSGNHPAKGKPCRRSSHTSRSGYWMELKISLINNTLLPEFTCCSIASVSARAASS